MFCPFCSNKDCFDISKNEDNWLEYWCKICFSLAFTIKSVG